MALWPLSDSPALVDQYGSDTSASLLVVVTGSATLNTKGAWTELIASSNEIYGLWLALRIASGNSLNTNVLMDVGIGPAGSEVVVVPDIILSGRNTIFPLGLPLYVPAGTRVAMRLASAVASKTVEVQAHTAPGGIIPVESFSDARTYGAVAATSNGTPPSAPGAINTKGDWTELTAATERDHRLIIPFIGKPNGTANAGANGVVDIGIGPVGSEVVIVPDLRYEIYTSEVINPFSPTLPCRIPVGTRIAARYATTSTSANTTPCVAVTMF